MKQLVTTAVLWIVLVSASAALCEDDPSAAGRLPGFEASRHFGEQVVTYQHDPDVRVHINAPGPENWRANRPTRLLLFALPNGNTIEQTVGRQPAPDLDWHFNIQHIGAQVRRVREADTDCNLVVAYLEAKGLSWPRWRREHEDEGRLIAEMIGSLRKRFGDCKVTLAAHSGGGSLVFGYIAHVDAIPDWLDRIFVLDANYAFSAELHSARLLDWLQSPNHFLGVYAYDDREIELDGKKIIGPTGGTFRATQRMLDSLSEKLEFTRFDNEDFERFQALDGRVELIRLHNNSNKILHTVMVERNGLIHGVTFGTPLEDKAGRFWGDRAYTEWIQPD